MGTPASGKSTWIKSHGLNPLTISADKIRLNLGGVTMTANSNYTYSQHINHNNEPKVWDMLYEQGESMMYNGQTLFVDNTHLYRSAFTKWNNFRKKYNYKTYVVDFMAPLIADCGNPEKAKELIKKWNRNRNFAVPDSTIDTYMGRYLHSIDHLPDWVTVITPKEVVRELQLTKTPNMERFKRIQVIGDIHADYDALMKVFEHHQKGDAYVFVGDYLDRGTKTLQTFKFITQELGGNNLFFCIGNHEDGWEKWVQKRERHGQFSILSLPKLQQAYSEKNLDKIIKNFVKNAHDYFAFDYFGKTFYVSHAGFEPIVGTHLDKLSTIEMPNALPRNTFIYGLGNTVNNDAYARDIDKVWHDTMPRDQINLHGHRNNFDRFCEGNSYNLTAMGKFRWLTITRDGIEPHEIDRIDVPELTEQLAGEEHIQQISLNDGITANNFDHDAFANNIWNQMSIRARGLFTRNDDVIGRGFTKFFQVDQLPTSTLDSIEYPVILEKKHDGFLTIAFYDNEAGKIKIFSKRGETDMAKLAKRKLEDSGMYDEIQRYYTDEKLHDTSLLFEIVAPKEDVHIIKYKEDHTYPLAIIKNDMNGIVLNLIKKEELRKKHPQYYNSVPFMQMRQNIWEANFYAIASNIDELKDFIARYGKEYPTREGVVLYGSNKMLKIKLPFYLKAKELRQALAKGGKRKWYYGAKEWYEKCQEQGITEFSPDLALKLAEEDEAE